ncbi:trimeric intracellular cation channel family protein [Lihuaxuella thermophila]|uniref:Uncharacterized membrane protein YeiH n=1 Tax=Lihuaxuella thermophila TaxID=1173111 RepID=A0A1H8E0X9_9BACL|nr:trimeric intracellular cation channel family protein [Lihuaxuella thermophila]SEN13100.1 Uncharacterized membrane protein YeiH [Lihuaxuella thermophila]
MTWDLFNLIGIAAFAISGAIVAMEEKYDIFGIYVLGLVTAFGGGIIRNALIGLPISTLWKQELFIYTALIAITLICLLPKIRISYWQKWLNFFDAIGLSAFSIQGALYAAEIQLPLVAVIIASVMTGIGGGVIRDVLAGRKPLVFQREIYALWSILIGIVIGLKWLTHSWELYALFVVIVGLRQLSAFYNWCLPGRLLEENRFKSSVSSK